MKKLKVTIELEIKGDPSDVEGIKEEVYTQLQELMEEGDLNYQVEESEEEDDEEEFSDF